MYLIKKKLRIFSPVRKTQEPEDRRWRNRGRETEEQRTGTVEQGHRKGDTGTVDRV
jgi:hypothetical protein